MALSRAALSLARLLDWVNIRNACYLYFFLAPVFLSRIDKTLAYGVFALGYLLSGCVAFLALSERLSRFPSGIGIPKETLFFVLMAAFCFFSLAVNSPGQLVSPGGFYFKYLKLVLPVISMVVMVRIWSLADIPRLYSLIGGFALISFGFLIYEALTSPGGLPRVGFILLDDRNKYALFLNIVYGVIFPKLLGNILKRRPIRLLVAANIALYLIFFLLQSRSGMFTCLILTVISLSATRSKKIILRAAVAAVPVILLFLTAVVLRYSEAVGARESDMGRYLGYMVGMNIVRDNPFLGIGYANHVNNHVYEQYGGMYYYLLRHPASIHNAMLETLAELGVFGLITYLLMVFVPAGILFRRIFRAGRKHYPVLGLAAASIPTAFFCYGLFYPGYLADDYFWVYMTIPLIVIRARIPDDFELKLPRPRLL